VLPKPPVLSVAECIHGLDVPLCDICYPKAPVERPRSSSARTPAPRTPALRSTPTTGEKPRTARASITAATQRIYHVTHMRNLEEMLTSGHLLAHARPVVDVSTPLTRELRATAEAAPGESVADFVSFSLAPDAVNWLELRDGALDTTRWSAAARAAAPPDFVFLVTTVAALGPSAVVTDGDAAGSLTHFASGVDIQRMLERLHDRPDSRLAAEALVKDSFPFAEVNLIGVAHDRARDKVRDVLATHSPASSTKVAVYPPWFQG
jgi:hypothetical protein